MSGALIAAYLASRRAAARGYDPDHIWNQLMLGLLLGIAGARIYYVAFEWERFAADPLSILNLTTGGLANPLVAVAEFSGSVLTAVLAIAVPLFALFCIGGLCLLMFLVSHRFVFGRRRRT